jgi:hypothetical protein
MPVQVEILTMKAANGLSALGIGALLALAGCSKLGSGPGDEMSWARGALERNDRIEVVASDATAGTFTVRMKDTGELRVVRLNQLIAGPPVAAVAGTSTQATPAAPGAPETASTGSAGGAAAAPSGASASGKAANAAAPAPGSTTANEPATPGEAAAPPGAPEAAATEQPRVVSATEAESAAPPHAESASGAPPGRVLASGPGYTISTADSKGTSFKRVAAAGPVPSANVERLHEPIICQGDRFLQIDNRNLEFDGDAVSAEDGCEIHITNSRITAKGVGVVARKASVHIENSDIEGDSGSIDASDGAQVYSTSSTFRGLRRRDDNAAFHDLGGNAWN